jgi:type I restriction enzyme R subunit
LAEERKDEAAAKSAKDRLAALVLFKNDMGAFVRLYTFLSQIFDYGTTDIEKRYIFYRRLIPLLEFGREREEVDLSKVVLTHHSLKSDGKRRLDLGSGEGERLKPIQDAGSGQVQDKDKAFLAEIIDKVNSLFEGELTEGDKVTFVKDVLRNKLLENDTLRNQAASNSKEQFANSPDLNGAVLTAIMDNMEAHESMATQALNSQRVLAGIVELLLGPLKLYEALKENEKAG